MEPWAALVSAADPLCQSLMVAGLMGKRREGFYPFHGFKPHDGLLPSPDQTRWQAALSGQSLAHRCPLVAAQLTAPPRDEQLTTAAALAVAPEHADKFDMGAVFELVDWCDPLQAKAARDEDRRIAGEGAGVAGDARHDRNV